MKPVWCEVVKCFVDSYRINLQNIAFKRRQCNEHKKIDIFFHSFISFTPIRPFLGIVWMIWNVMEQVNPNVMQKKR